MDNLPSMSIFGHSTVANDKANPTHAALIPSDVGPTTFKSLLDAQLTTQGSSLSSGDKVDPTLSDERSSIMNNFLTRLWQNDPGGDNKVDFSTPMKFIKSIADPAHEAAARLGTSPQVVIAIAALETGWGKHVIEGGDGHSSHNLFGIKSSGQKTDTTVFANTTEYIDGKKLTLEQPFRSYASAAESVGDFADFIQSNPRYENALLAAHDAQIFIEQIHHAGYATDPNYAEKVKSVMVSVEKMMNSPQYHQLN